MHKLKKVDNQWLTSRRTFVYTLNPHKEGISVNYAPGKSETFTCEADAIHWINNIHYPDKVRQLQEELGL